MSDVTPEIAQEVERQQMAVDIACVGFGPAMGGFLTTLTREMAAHPAQGPAFTGCTPLVMTSVATEAMPGMRPSYSSSSSLMKQALCPSASQAGWRLYP